MTDETGFSAAVVVPAPPEAVFGYFTSPALFARWFVVDGFSTPADEIELEPRPGGTIGGVMVSHDGSSRIPFQLRYGRLDPPRLAQFIFDEADEAVTLDVQPTDDGRTRVSYHKPYGSAGAASGAQSMLDALAGSIAATATGSHPGIPSPELAGLVKRIALPADFSAPTKLAYADIRAHAISRLDLDDDVAGINASVDLIRRTRGGQWPSEPVTAEGNYIDLVWHECEFRDGTSFTYAVYQDNGGYLGCCYLYPVGVRTPLSADLLQHDVDISWWVTPDAYAAGHYETLYEALRVWASREFVFTNPYFSNIQIPVISAGTSGDER